ncbi:MAG TPA: hypothetical protein VMH85_04685 [Terriglobales bacterium]|nr:hypothetical protein [Terriglobales bacterium]
MENQEAVQVMRSLARGLDPDSEKPLEPGSICLRPKVVKTLNRALGALLQVEQREREKPTNAGRYWSRAEDAQICDEVRRGVDLHEIAKTHNRTIGSIIVRLVKLGKITAPGAPSADAAQGNIPLSS